MTEFWVSKSKHYCKICNAWMADNKMSIQHHESSVKHQQLVVAAKQKKRDEKLYGARDEADLKRQLREIDKAAQESIQQDRISDSFRMFNHAPLIYQPNKQGYHQNPLHAGDWNNRSHAASAQPSDLRNEADDGMYTVGNMTYMEGKMHADKLYSGMACEVFVEAVDEWVPATIVLKQDTLVPNTAIVLTTLRVSYLLRTGGSTGNASTEAEKEVVENNVKTDRIRIVVSSDMKMDAGAMPASLLSAPDAGLVDVAVKPKVRSLLDEPVPEASDTPINQWETVAVQYIDTNGPAGRETSSKDDNVSDGAVEFMASRYVDPEIRYVDPEIIESKTQAQTPADTASGKSKIRMNLSNVSVNGKTSGKTSHAQLLQEKVEIAKQLASQLHQSDDVMHSFDPYNTNTYKGVKLGDDVMHYERNAATSIGGINGSTSANTNSVSIGFKKRKIDTKLKKKPVRQKLDDED